MLKEACVAAAFLLVACAASPEDTASSASEIRTTIAERGIVGGRICSWNIRRLGHRFDDLDKDMVATAKIIEDHCDVVAAQEVMRTTPTRAKGYEALLAQLGTGWGGMVAEAPVPNDPPSSNSEHYAFYFRKAAAAPCPGTNVVTYLPDEQDAFLREPAWACIKVKNHPREMVIASYHAVFGSMAERRREVKGIAMDLDFDGQRDDLFRKMAASRPAGADVVLLGDFNLKPNEMADVLPTYKDLTNGNGSTVNAENAITDNQYDHLLVQPSSQLASLPPAEVLDVRDYAGPSGFFKTVSDHLPIRFTLPNAAINPDPGPGPGPLPDGPYGPGSVAPLENGDSPSPAEFPIKGNKDSMLYHTPDSPYFRFTKAEVWFKSEEHASTAGFKRWRALP